MKQAAAKFEQIVGSIHGEIKGLPAALDVIRDATDASAQALQDLIPVGARAVANLDVSVAAFRTTIDREFTEAAKIHLEASKSLDAAVEQMRRALDHRATPHDSAVEDLDQSWIADRPR
jgi:hypothetical protein